MGVIQNIIFPKRSSFQQGDSASRHSPSEDTVATTNVTMFSQLNMKWWQLHRCLADEAPWGLMGFLVSKWRILSGQKSVYFFQQKTWFVLFFVLWTKTRNIIFITKVVRYFHDIDVFDTPWSRSVPSSRHDRTNLDKNQRPGCLIYPYVSSEHMVVQIQVFFSQGRAPDFPFDFSNLEEMYLLISARSLVKAWQLSMELI